MPTEINQPPTNTAVIKGAILSFVFIFSVFCSANCQWYYKSCGVSDINNVTKDEFDCLWKNANKIVKVGRTTCAVGTAFMIAGGITMLATDPCCSSGQTLLGFYTVIGGTAINIVGLPIWLVGAKRKSKLKASRHFNNQGLGTIRLTPIIQGNHFNSSHTFGITATISF